LRNLSVCGDVGVPRHLAIAETAREYVPWAGTR
jgi:hypothetical protein